MNMSKNMKIYLEPFVNMTRVEQREHILSVAERCIDGAPVSLARKIEIYLSGEES